MFFCFEVVVFCFLVVDKGFLLYFGERLIKFIEEADGKLGIFGMFERTGYSKILERSDCSLILINISWIIGVNNYVPFFFD